MSVYFFRGGQILLDLFTLSLAYWLAFLLRFEFSPGIQILKLLFFTWPYVVIFQYLVLTLFRVPRFTWRFIGITEVKWILFSLSISTAVLTLLRFGLAPLGGYARYAIVPFSVIGMNFILSFLGIAGIRVLGRIWGERRERHERCTESASEKRTVLIGAGSAGVLIAREIAQNPNLGINILGFLDDDKTKINNILYGHKVLGNIDSLPEQVEKHQIDQAIICIAAAPGKVIRRIVKICEKISLPVKIIPGIYEIIGDRINVSRIREVTIDDLLGRDAVELNVDLIAPFFKDRVVMVTGAGGSIGAELCRQIVRFAPKALILLEQAETPLFNIHEELKSNPNISVIPCIADICDSDRIDQVFIKHSPQIVFHAAAYKHVPMMETSPGEAIKNNISGTKEIADAANRHKADVFILISSDKAVNPSSIMGMSKRVAEIYIQELSKHSRTKYVSVRFGNVLGSAGSVIPIFKEQIVKGGPVTITHPEMKRFFMTIPEACQLVMQASSMGKGGEIFILDMGEPVHIIELAKDLIRLSGFTEEDIPIKITGIRPGEKLFEELYFDKEKMTKTRHPKIYIGKTFTPSSDDVEKAMAQLLSFKNSDSVSDIRAAFRLIIKENLPVMN